MSRESLIIDKIFHIIIIVFDPTIFFFIPIIVFHMIFKCHTNCSTLETIGFIESRYCHSASITYGDLHWR